MYKAVAAVVMFSGMPVVAGSEGKCLAYLERYGLEFSYHRGYREHVYVVLGVSSR